MKNSLIILLIFLFVKINVFADILVPDSLFIGEYNYIYEIYDTGYLKYQKFNITNNGNNPIQIKNLEFVYNEQIPLFIYINDYLLNNLNNNLIIDPNVSYDYFFGVKILNNINNLDKSKTYNYEIKINYVENNFEKSKILNLYFKFKNEDKDILFLDNYNSFDFCLNNTNDTIVKFYYGKLLNTTDTEYLIDSIVFMNTNINYELKKIGNPNKLSFPIRFENNLTFILYSLSKLSDLTSTAFIIYLREPISNELITKQFSNKKDLNINEVFHISNLNTIKCKINENQNFKISIFSNFQNIIEIKKIEEVKTISNKLKNNELFPYFINNGCSSNSINFDIDTKESGDYFLNYRVYFKYNNFESFRDFEVELFVENTNSVINTNTHSVIFPNPSSYKISLDLGVVSVADLVVYDILGNEIMSIPNYANKSEIDISTLSIGTYTIQIQTNTGSISQRLLVHR